MSVLLLNKKCNVKIFCIASASRYAKKYFQTVQNKHLNASDNSVEISYFVKFKVCPYIVIKMHHETLNEYSYHHFCLGNFYLLHFYSHVISSVNLFSPSHFKDAKQRSMTHWRLSLKNILVYLQNVFQGTLEIPFNFEIWAKNTSIIIYEMQTQNHVSQVGPKNTKKKQKNDQFIKQNFFGTYWDAHLSIKIYQQTILTRLCVVFCVFLRTVWKKRNLYIFKLSSEQQASGKQ